MSRAKTRPVNPSPIRLEVDHKDLSLVRKAAEFSGVGSMAMFCRRVVMENALRVIGDSKKES